MTRNRQSLDLIKSTTQRVEHLKKIAPNAVNQQQNASRLSIASTSSDSSGRNSSSSSPSSRANTNTQRRNASTPQNMSQPQKITTRRSQTLLSKSPTENTKPNSLKRVRQTTKQTTKDKTQSISPSSESSFSHSRYSTPRTRNNISNKSITVSPSVSPLPKRRSVSNQSPTTLRDLTVAKELNKSLNANQRRDVKNDTKSNASKIPTRSIASSTPLTSVSTKSQLQATRQNRSLQTISTKSKLPLRKGTRSVSQVAVKRK